MAIVKNKNQSTQLSLKFYRGKAWSNEYTLHEDLMFHLSSLELEWNMAIRDMTQYKETWTGYQEL